MSWKSNIHYILNNQSYKQIAKKYNSSVFSIQKIIKSSVDQSIIDKNKMQPISEEFGNKIIQEYIITDLTAQQIGFKYNVSKYVVYDILRGKTFKIREEILNQIKMSRKLLTQI